MSPSRVSTLRLNASSVAITTKSPTIPFATPSSSTRYSIPSYERGSEGVSDVLSNLASAAFAASVSLAATTAAKLGSSAWRLVAQMPASSPSHEAKSFSHVSPSPSSASASSISSRSFAPGSSVRMILPAAASASSRRSPSGWTAASR